jgi:hypothetical protein
VDQGFLEDTGKVLYRSGMIHGSNKKNFEIFTPEQFIAAIAQLIIPTTTVSHRGGACQCSP